MITIREIADNDTSISSTRWAFSSVIVFDIIIISITVIAYIVAHFMDKPFDSNLVSGVTLLLGTLTTMVSAPKVLQGFEPKNKKSETIEIKEIDNDGK